jgi:hypothetical protein
MPALPESLILAKLELPVSTTQVKLWSITGGISVTTDLTSLVSKTLVLHASPKIEVKNLVNLSL